MLAEKPSRTSQETRLDAFRQRFGEELASFALGLNRRNMPGSQGFVCIEYSTNVDYLPYDKFHTRFAELLVQGLLDPKSGNTQREKAEWLADLLKEANAVEPVQVRTQYVDRPSSNT